MSGICGLVRLDGGSATPEQLAPIWSSLAFRGPDGEGLWADGPVALGFRLLATTPEALSEQQPFHHSPSGCVIVADARLDNREDLAAALGIGLGRRGDGELILLSYLKWGDHAPPQLLGDFAFAIWDPRRHRLVAARDQMGLRQIHVTHLPGKLVAFATDDHALVASPEVSARLNLVRVADYLVDLEAADLTSTFYRDVERLRPAHLLICEQGRVSIRRYWSLQPVELHTGSQEEQEREFLSLFEQSVAARLRSTGRIGAMLSGGLDSSSVVAMAAKLQMQNAEGPLSTFSATSAHWAECTETAMIRQVQKLGNISPFEVSHDSTDPFDPLSDAALFSLNPFDHHMSLIREVYSLASRQGCNVLLDGVAADMTFDYSGRPARLLRRGQLVEAWRHCDRERQFFCSPRSTSRRFGDAIRAALAPHWIKELKREVEHVRDRLRTPEPLRSEFAREVDVARRFDLMRRVAPSPARSFMKERIAAITHPYLAVGRERYDRVASTYGIEPRDPFMDLRLVKFALALPTDQLGAQGWTKPLLRQAMAGLLPEAVRWRRGKQHLGPLFSRKIRQGAGREKWQEAVRGQRGFLEKIIQPQFLDDSHGWLASNHSIKIQSLARWLSNLKGGT